MKQIAKFDPTPYIFQYVNEIIDVASTQFNIVEGSINGFTGYVETEQLTLNIVGQVTIEWNII